MWAFISKNYENALKNIHSTELSTHFYDRNRRDSSVFFYQKHLIISYINN